MKKGNRNAHQTFIIHRNILGSINIDCIAIIEIRIFAINKSFHV